MEQATVIIFGATGDLTKRKIIPALYRLLKNKQVSRLALIGVARKQPEISSILQEARQFVGKVNKSSWNKMKGSSYYYQLDFYNRENYQQLEKLLQNVEKKHRLSGNRLFYLATAKKINSCLSRVFKEEQVFRIDHYLGKELVGNISILRFANRVLEPLWNCQHVESIQVIMNEKIGIEGRGWQTLRSRC